MTGFATRDEASLRDAAAAAVEQATALGADAASATARAGGGISIKVRGDTAESAVRDAYQALSLTVYRDGRTGSASTVALDPPAIARMVAEAHAIAGLVQADADAGLASPEMLAWQVPVPAMFAPSGQSPDALLARALEMAALTADAAAQAPGIVRAGEVAVSSGDHLWALATSAGFCRSAAGSTHAQWATALAEDDSGATVRDFAQASDRRFDALGPVSRQAQQAVDRAVAQRGGRSIAGRVAPVLFDARIAPTLIHALTQALSGHPQFSRATWLPGALDTMIAADHLDLVEDPFEPFGMASGAWDHEGVAGSRRAIVEHGRCMGYFLGTRSARRLGMRSTGNADGPWNLTLASHAPGGDAAAMRRRLDTGLLVTQLQGGGSDPVTGNWTQAVAGFWVEKGEIVHPVIDVTLGGQLGAMWRGIVAVGDDRERQGAVRTGSILIDAMQMGGRA